MVEAVTNWAGNVTFGARRVLRPESVDELRRLVAAGTRLRVLGSGHSFNPIADTDGDLISLDALPPVVAIDHERATVTVSGGVRYGKLALRLHESGYALPNLASLPHISVAGAVATATHGSGVDNRGLASAVSALSLVRASGDVEVVARGGETFEGSVVSLGALGVVADLTLDLVPAFDVAQVVYDDLPGDVLAANVDEILASAYSVSLFTDWSGAPEAAPPRVNQVWRKFRVTDGVTAPRRWFGAVRADGPRHPLAGMPARNCTEQDGVPGPWYARLPHFRLEFTPSAGDELQSEYFVARADAVAALSAVGAVRDAVAQALQISEIRTVAADEAWLSPAYRRDCVALHFTWVGDEARVRPAIDALEAALSPLRARPHWGKLFHRDPRGDYPRLADAAELARTVDPDGVFRNTFIDSFL
ncbi:FAD-binding protein [Luedemannella helvata]|uniref:Alditol oxidase n=1 Tax=Luedemannella helvata TaxID=349315 RepID=A0ABP4W5A2_9ACTN